MTEAHRVQDAAELAIERRMTQQLLWRPADTGIAGVVQALVGMQAQEFPYALWSVAQRLVVRPDRAAMLAGLR